MVGEWQLLADLSFADFLMWVRRDDGALVCVAQVRPNTAPTVLLADAVGTLNQGDRDAGGDRCVQLRRHRQAKPMRAQEDSAGSGSSTWRLFPCGTTTTSSRS